MGLVNPLSWSVLGFGDETAWTDFLGSHALWHAAVDDVVRRQFNAPPYPTLPIGDGGGDDWHQAHQDIHNGECAGLGIRLSPDLRSYDLSDPAQFATWCFLHAQDCQRIRVAANL